MMRWLHHRGVQVLLTLALYLAIAPLLPAGGHQIFYTISLLIKDLLLWLLPFTVAFFIAHAISSFERKAPLFLLTLFLFEALSNGLSVWYAFGTAHIAAGSLPSFDPPPLFDAFAPLWRLPSLRPSWWSADKGSFLGAAIGLFAAFLFPSLKGVIRQGKRISELVLTRFFSRLIPLFILGFVARMYQTNLLGQLFHHYADLILWLLLFLALYLLFLCAIGSGAPGSTFLKRVKNLLPAGGIAFSSGCSLSTLPWTIEGASKNLVNPDLAKAVIPATTNIQQIGDCIANAFLCFLIYRHFYGYNPDLSMWLSFSLVFVLARFATAAVLGGAIFIMIPIYEHYLSFTSEMTALILAFNVILDPLITCGNVVANGALCRVFERVWLLVSKEKGLSLTK